MDLRTKFLTCWTCALVCLLASCKPKGEEAPPTPTPPPTSLQKSALLGGTMTADTGVAVVTADSLRVHGLVWSVPPGWTLSPTGLHPRIAEMRTTGNLNILVFSLGRGGGSVAANLQRWRSQFQPVTDSAIEWDTTGGVAQTIGQWTGSYRGGDGSVASDGSRQTMVGAVVEGPGGRVFFKVVGEPRKLRSERESIYRWIRSGKAPVKS